LFEAAEAQENTDEEMEKLREEIASAMWAYFVQNWQYYYQTETKPLKPSNIMNRN
jgi:hypothetical protein